MDISLTLSLIGLLFSSYIFYLYASKVNKEELTLNGFMCADGNLNKNQFSATFAASNFSLAMTLMYLLGNAKYLGWFLLVSPATYLIGHYLFIYLIKETSSTFDIKECRTLSDLVYLILPSRKISLLITAMTVSSYLMLLFIELYIGSILFSFFMPSSAVTQTLSFLAIGVLVLLYVRLGGYKAIVQTDKWQLFLMMSSIAAVFVFGLIVPNLNNEDVKQLLIRTTSYTADDWFVALFIVWLALVNSALGFSQIANWQRVAATKNPDISLKGMMDSSWKVLFLLLLTITGFILVNSKGYELTSLTDFLFLVKNTGGLSSYVLFPVLIVGFASMVFSSADIALIAIGYTLTDRNSFSKYFSSMDEAKLRRVLTNSTLVILVILSAIFYLNYSGLQGWLMPLIYTTAGQLIILTPIPIYVLLKMRKYGEFKPISVVAASKFILFTGVIVAWGMLFVGAYLSKVTSDQLYALLSMPLGALAVFISFMIAKRNPYGANYAILNNRFTKNLLVIKEKK